MTAAKVGPGAKSKSRRKKPAPIARPLLSGHEPSPQQMAIFAALSRPGPSLIVEARAGTGKTTTIKNVLPYLPEHAHVHLLAFNVSITRELKEAITELQERASDPSCWFTGHDFLNFVASSFHSVGFGAAVKFLGKRPREVKVDSRKCRNILKEALNPVEFSIYSAFVIKLVGYAKGEGIGALVPDVEQRWLDLVDHHGLYLEDEKGKIDRAVDIARKLLARSSSYAEKHLIMDYDDQLYLPLLWKLRFWQNDYVFLDEAQDTNPVRRAIARLLLKPGGRLISVGDPAQAIYGFTGASHDAMDLIQRDFGARKLPLAVSYRCAKSVVQHAQQWVPEIQAPSTAPAGEVLAGVRLEDLDPPITAADAILCRNNAPLIGLAYELIAKGTGCRILGREIGDGLVNLVEKMQAKGIERLVEKLEAFCEREMARFTAKGDEIRAEGVADRVACVMTVIEHIPENDRTVPAVVRQIETLFASTDGVLTLATVHKAKGLEWDTVAILRPDLMPSRGARSEWQYQQETNLEYVAATRAKRRLVYLESGK